MVFIKNNKYAFTKEQTVGSKNLNWKGGRFTDKKGYVYVYSPDHPNKTANNVVFEHRLVMVKHLARHLTKNESVHHINGDVGDNRVSNLKLMTIGEHMSLHSKENVKKRQRDNKGRFIVVANI